MRGVPVAATPLQELFDACLVLFGPETSVSEEYLKYLRPAGLKSAYRKIALETHPDRARALGKRPSELNARFTEVSLAYRKLNAAIKDDGILLADPPPDYRAPEKPAAQPKKKKQRRKNPDHFFRGTPPQRHLLFGQFLFYSGIVSWKTYIRAARISRISWSVSKPHFMAIWPSRGRCRRCQIRARIYVFQDTIPE